MSALTRGSLAERIAGVALREQPGLGRLLAAIRRREKRSAPADILWARLEDQLAQAEQRIAQRRAVQPRLSYPEELPISRYRDDILRGLAQHRVLIVCGDTGSGKTTQLPKLCLEAGRGVLGAIGVTQPRRIAARAMANRLAAETDLELGQAVGLKVRFTDHTGPLTLVKVMTDGILLNEIRADRLLRAYDTLIVDEAHERSLNIDFLLGYLRRIRDERPDLKVVIASATIDPERLATHFDNAPVLRIEGRSFPIELRYRAPKKNSDLSQGVVAAVQELVALPSAGSSASAAQDILVFLPGERWIKECEGALRRALPGGYETLPLYARLSVQQQDRVFKPGTRARIVLATNVAETSLTVPRIGYVIDSGLARVSRYAPRHRLQGLGVEPIAQANAVQRAGRCGRLGPGVCIRLFDETDFNARPLYTDPEITRTNLAGVILRLEALGLGHIDDFPFLDTPPTAAVADAYRLLQTLAALDEQRHLTADGGIMAQLPLDPRLARLLLSAQRAGVLAEGLVLAAGLSVVDPRERAPELRESQNAIADRESDFSSYLALWAAYRREKRKGYAALRAWCAAEKLALTRLREWEDVHQQLGEIVRQLGWCAGERPADYKTLHQAIIAAFVDQVLERMEGAQYRGAQGMRAQLQGTPVARKAPRWLVAAERVATERVYLRTVARINPRWVEQAAPHLIKRSYRDPSWSERHGRVMALEVVQLFGMTLSAERRADYGPIAPAEARDIFIREALLADALGADVPCLARNRALRHEVLDWEARLRVRDLLVGDRSLYEFYATRLPEHVCDRQTFVTWCRNPLHDEALTWTSADILTRDHDEVALDACPRTMDLSGHALALEYVYEPGAENDGITLRLPRVLLDTARAESLDWLVPGWRHEKVVGLLRSLPKELRRACVPLPDTARRLMPALEELAPRLEMAAALSEVLTETGLVAVTPEIFSRSQLPPHLSLRIALLDEQGGVLAAGRDLRALQREFGRAGEPFVSAFGAGNGWSRKGLSRWDFPDLPSTVTVPEGGIDLKLYPALIEQQGEVNLALLAPGRPAEQLHRAGTRRLLQKSLQQQIALIRRDTRADRELLLLCHGVASEEVLLEDLVNAATEQSFALDPPIRSRAEFERRLSAGRPEFVPNAERLRDLLATILREHRALRAKLSSAPNPSAVADLSAQLEALVYPGFLTATPPEWRTELPRYLRAAQLRSDKISARHPKDQEFQKRVQAAAKRLEQWRERQPAGWPWPAGVLRYRWLLEEFRVSLYAQTLGTRVPVSEKRLEEFWREAIATN